MTTALKKQEISEGEQLPVPVDGKEPMLAMIERIATSPTGNVENLERMMALYERDKQQRAKAAYLEALVKMKPLLPIIDRRGRITIRDKMDKEKITQNTPYALWEDIDEAITPILAENGFVLTFRSGVALDGKITVTGVLGHKDGWTEETTITLPHDSSGSKNAVQAVGSSTSYGKRYTATLLLNIRTKGEDDDGEKGGSAAPITEEQVAQLSSLIIDTKADEKKFCEYMEVAKLEELPASKFKTALNAFKAKKKNAEKAK